MKQELLQLTKRFSMEISQAKATGFEAVVLPYDDCEAYFLDNIDDEEYIFNMADEFGWDMFAIIDLVGKQNKIIDLSLIEAA